MFKFLTKEVIVEKIVEVEVPTPIFFEFSTEVKSFHPEQIGMIDQWKKELNSIAVRIQKLVSDAQLTDIILPRGYRVSKTMILVKEGGYKEFSGLIVGNHDYERRFLNIEYIGLTSMEFGRYTPKTQTTMDAYMIFSDDVKSGLIKEINAFVISKYNKISDDMLVFQNIM